jgi:hypothetical protein
VVRPHQPHQGEVPVADDIRADIEAAAAMAEQMKNSEAFKYYSSMGGFPKEADLRQAGWTPAHIEMFRGLLNEGGPRQTLGDSLNEGMNEAGFTTERTVDDQGVGHTTVTGRKQ